MILETKPLDDYAEIKVVAEACCNHMGNMDIALEIIKSAKICGANYVKFQKRDPYICVPKELQEQPHPNESHAFGSTYLEHRLALEFNVQQHKSLKDTCDNLGIGYACSVWDILSAQQIIDLGVDYIKIPSAMNGNYDLMDYVYDNYNKEVHVALGMSTQEERNEMIARYRSHIDRTIFYWTTSGYPVKFDELFLLEIRNLRQKGLRVGYSGHHLGIAVDIAAFTLGASWIERHFTLDRTWKGTDQAASLEPLGLQKLCRDLAATQKSLAHKNALTSQEVSNSKKLRVVSKGKQNY